MSANWIGPLRRGSGASSAVDELDIDIPVFTDSPRHVVRATFLVLPGDPLVGPASPSNRPMARKIRATSAGGSQAAAERAAGTKTGVSPASSRRIRFNDARNYDLGRGLRS